MAGEKRPYVRIVRSINETFVVGSVLPVEIFGHVAIAVNIKGYREGLHKSEYEWADPPQWESIEATTAPPSSAASILHEAATIVAGDRNDTHGASERSFQAIAGLWNAYLDARKGGGPLTPTDVAACMVLLKLARSVQGKPVRDHFVDAAGYAALAGELVG